jgi:hypothetical protein
VLRVEFLHPYCDYLRSADGRAEAARRLKAWILDEFRKWAGGSGGERHV